MALGLLGQSGVVVATPWGGRFLARRGDAAFLLGVCYEPLETAVIWRLLAPGMTVIDVGANRGWYTVLAAHRTGQSGRVLALEPGSVALAHLRTNLALNPFCAGVELLELAAGERSALAELIETADPATSHLAIAGGAPEQGLRVRTVRQARLDDVAAERALAAIDWVKIDVEGAEVRVLEGMSSILAGASLPLLLIEGLDVNLRRFGTDLEGLIQCLAELSGDRYEVYSLCRRHGCAETQIAACRDASPNLLALPRARSAELLGALFGT